MNVSLDLNRNDVNVLKNYIMASYQYCKKVYNGIENHTQFQSWLQLCYAHVNNCNFWTLKLEPFIKFIPTTRCKLYKDFRFACEYTVDSLQMMISEYNEAYAKELEQIEMNKQIEMRARIEHEIAIEYKETLMAQERAKCKPIGFNTAQEINNDINDSNNQ